MEEQIAGGTDSIIVCGTTGEASTLTHEEHIRAIQFVIDVTKKRIPVIAGTGSNCTATAQYLSKCAEEAGADGLLLVSPYYNKATQKGLIRHFTAIAEVFRRVVAGEAGNTGKAGNIGNAGSIEDTGNIGNAGNAGQRIVLYNDFPGSTVSAIELTCM